MKNRSSRAAFQQSKAEDLFGIRFAARLPQHELFDVSLQGCEVELLLANCRLSPRARNLKGFRLISLTKAIQRPAIDLEM